MAGVWMLTVFVLASTCWVQLILGTSPPGRFGESCLYSCHCGDSCSQTTGACVGDCDSGWVGGHGANCQKENVAYKRTASSPTRLFFNSWSADKAVDGNRDQDVHHDSCFNAADFTWGLWTVDLGRQYRIHDVKIYLPSIHPGRIRSCVLYLSDTSSSTGLPCYAFPSDTTVNSNGIYNATCDGTGRYFSISNTTLLNLFCSPGLFGETCNEFCHCAEEACDHVSGLCPGFCRPGWQGDRCDTECDADHYGVNCRNTCTDRKCSDVISSCDRYSGSCDRGCLPGWRGVDCTQECTNGTYGQNCSMVCSGRKCAGDSSCDHVAGKCDAGCVAGRMGADCKKACDSQHYGPNCAKACTSRHCAGNSSCKPTGDCDTGCEEGWAQVDCTVCESGAFGVACTETCGRCADNNNCDPGSGTCDSGCVEGYTGPQCKDQDQRPTGMSIKETSSFPDIGEELLTPVVTVTAIFVTVAVAVAVGIIIWKRRRPALQESESHDYYNTSHFSKTETKQSQENEETHIETGTYECINVMSDNAHSSAEAYCTLNPDKPAGATHDEVAEKKGDDIYEPTEPRTYETLDSTSRSMDGDYDRLC